MGDTTTKVTLAADMHGLLVELFPLCRSLTGPGVRETLKILRREFPGLSIYEVPSGTPVFDWTVPEEWAIREAWVKNSHGEKVIDFCQSNLHVVGYSMPFKGRISFAELRPHLHTLPEQKDVVPYVTSYYQRDWGFCLSHQLFEHLESFGDDAVYDVLIDSSLDDDGVMNFADILLPGESDREILISCYVCHPSLANNELSGPVVAIFLARWLAMLEQRHFTYRIVFVPETIGSLAYIAKHERHLREKVYAAFNLTCVGDDRAWSCVATPKGNTLSDEVACLALRQRSSNFERHSYLARGSDERQYASPGLGIPMVSIMRSRFGDFPEYHNSADNCDFVTPEALEESLACMQSIITGLEYNLTPQVVHKGEPQLGRRNLYPTHSGMIISKDLFYAVWDFLAYADGETDLLRICALTGLSIEDACEAQALLLDKHLVTVARRYRSQAGPLPPASTAGVMYRPNRSFF